MSTTLPLFWRLSSSLKQDRIDASVKLVGALEHFQSKFTPIPSEPHSEDEGMNVDSGRFNDGLDGSNAPDVSYSIRRLIRGLASPRESSRLGFAVALTELLSRLDTVSASQIIALISQASQTHGSMKGQEERDMLFARLFGITSLVQSGLLFRSVPPTTSIAPSGTLTDFQEVVIMLLALPKKKSFLREPSYYAFILALRALAASDVGWKDEAWTYIGGVVFADDKSWSPEKVGIALSMLDMGIEMDWKRLLTPTFKHGHILSSGNLNNLAKILSDADIGQPDNEGGNSTKQSTTWRPQLHFVWDLILDVYFPRSGVVPSKHRHKASFLDFFKVAVDESLLASTSSDGRKLWGFEFFRVCLTRVPPSDLPRLFTPNFMRSWVNHLSKPDRYLHKAAKLVASSLPAVITTNPEAGFPILVQLFQTNSHFHRLTRTKTVESLLAAMDVKGVEEYVCYLGQIAHGSHENAPVASGSNATATCIWVADQFAMLIRNGAIPNADTWISNVLNFFLLHGLFKIKKKNEKSHNQWLHASPQPAIPDAVRAAYRIRLLSCLAELTSQTTLARTGDEKTVRNTGSASDGELWVSKTFHAIAALGSDAKHVVRVALTEGEAQEESTWRDRTLEVLKKLKTIGPDRKEASEGVELLLLATFLYRSLSDEGGKDADMEMCLDNVLRLIPDLVSDENNEREVIKVQVDADEVQMDDNIAPINGVVDMLIGYLEMPAYYLRIIANRVFGSLTALVDKDTVELILAQLERRDPTLEESEEDLASLEEEVGRSDGASSDSDSAELASNTAEEVGEKLEPQERSEDAPQVSDIGAVTEDTEVKSGSDSDSSDEAVMDDGQMMQLDERLAEMFRSRANEKRSGSGAQREATHFKNRVLDLVDIFLRKEPTSQFVPTFILPLVRVISGTGPDENQLSDKVTALLRNRIGKAKEIPTIVDAPQIRKTLEELHVMARKCRSPDVRETISVCSLYLTRILLSGPNKDDSAIVGVYRTSLSDFATRKASPLQSNFIQEFVRRQPRCAWQMRDDFVHVAQKAVNVYRKCQTYQLLHPLFTQLVGHDINSSELVDFLGTFRQGLYITVSDACDDPESLNTSQMKELLALSLLVIRQSKRAADNIEGLRTAFCASDWMQLLDKLKTSRFKNATSLHVLLQRMLSALGLDIEPTVLDHREQIKPAKQRKRKGEDTNTTDAKRARPRTVNDIKH